MASSDPAPSPPTDDNYVYCETRLKEGDRTAWLAALFAPAAKRPGLHALGAFAVDIEEVRSKVREPLAGELRLQWWTDAIEGETRGDVRGHPIAAALIDTIRRTQLSRAALTGFIDAKRDDFYDEPIASIADFDSRADCTEGALIASRAYILLGRREPSIDEAARHAGRAIAVVETFRALRHGATPMHMTVPLDLLRSQGIGGAEMRVRSSSPAILAAVAALRDHALDEIKTLRALRHTLDPAVGPAFLTASLVEPMLRRSMWRGYDPFTTSIDLPQWRRQWILWRAAGRNGVL
jgi:phytoene synthase